MCTLIGPMKTFKKIKVDIITSKFSYDSFHYGAILKTPPLEVSLDTEARRSYCVGAKEVGFHQTGLSSSYTWLSKSPRNTDPFPAGCFVPQSQLRRDVSPYLAVQHIQPIVSHLSHRAIHLL